MINKLNKIGKSYKYFDIKSFDLDGRTIMGYASVFGVVDKDNDLLVKGCFTKSINERGPDSLAKDKIICLWMHDMKEPIGQIIKLEEDEHGLYFEAHLDDVPEADRALKQLKSGTLNQFSIGFAYIHDKCEWIEKDGKYIYVVKEVALYEISVVSIGANGETEFLGAKSNEDIEQSAFDIISKETEEICKGLDIRKKEKIQALISKIIRLSLLEKKPEIPLKEIKADKSKKSMFDVKLKNN